MSPGFEDDPVEYGAVSYTHLDVYKRQASHSFPTTGTTYDYEKGAGSITRLRWDDAKQMLTPHGAAGWSEPDSKIVKIAGH